jgi:putative methyltransferase (TIGR04325 family)
MNNEFFIWEGVFKDFYSAKKFADGFGFSGETYNTRALDAAKECLSSLEKKEPIPFFHKQRSVLLPPVAAMMLNQQSKIDILDFGGGLGIGYMTLKESITNANQKINYTILELPEICIQGRDLHKNEINFLDTFPNTKEFQLIHSSSAIQYIEDWQNLIKKLCSFNAKYILMSDVFAGDFETFVTLQNYYSNKIPHWFFNHSLFTKVFAQNGYDLMMRTFVSAKRLNYEDELPMNNFEDQNKLKYTSHMLFVKQN